MVENKIAQVKKISDDSLSKISAGITCEQMKVIGPVTVGVAIGGGIGTVLGTATSAILSSKALKAMHEGNAHKSEQYNKAAKYLSIVSASLGGCAILSAATNLIAHSEHHKTCPCRNTEGNPSARE